VSKRIGLDLASQRQASAIFSGAISIQGSRAVRFSPTTAQGTASRS
jgi:hypothetical protein